MRNYLLTMLLLLTCTVQAQVKMRDIVRTMPDSLVPYLKHNARLDFVDFIDSGMRAEVSNELGGKSRLTELTDDFADLSLNTASTIQLRLLETDEAVDDARQIVCMVRTYGRDICESSIQFFSVKWRLLPLADRIELPSYMHRFVLHSNAPELTVERETGLDMPANEEQQKTEKELTTFKWDGKSFKKS
jgi:hypothetical protein